MMKRTNPSWVLRSSALLLALIAGSWTFAAFAQTDVVKSSISACEKCHGREGNSSYDLIPRINGQQPLYIIRRLDEMNRPGYDSPPPLPFAMQQAAHVPESIITEIAQYFTSRPPTPPTKGDAAGLGAQIYHQGIPSRKVAPCAGCHGSEGEGSGMIPRIAGQHQAYLKMWLGMRSGFLLPGSGAMYLAVRNLTPDEIDAVTFYLARD